MSAESPDWSWRPPRGVEVGFTRCERLLREQRAREAARYDRKIAGDSRSLANAREVPR